MHNLYNVRYPLSAQRANMDTDFRKFVPASKEIVVAVLEGTYDTIVKPRKWREPHAMPYEKFSESKQKTVRSVAIRWQQPNAFKSFSELQQKQMSIHLCHRRLRSSPTKNRDRRWLLLRLRQTTTALPRRQVLPSSRNSREQKLHSRSQ